MASAADFDLSQLSANQQEALQQYTDVTGQEFKDAVPLLQRSQWNVQIAIAKFFDGEGPDIVAEAQAAQNHIPLEAARLDNLQESLITSAGRPSRAVRPSRTELAPRVVPQPPVIYQPPFLVAALFAPFQLGYRVVSAIIGLLHYILSFLPRSLRPRVVTGSIRRGWKATSERRVTLPKETAERFRREFEEEYGSHELIFFDGGHAQALDAAKRDLKFLLTVLVSPEHDDTESFIKNTLLSPEVVAFLNNPANNVIVWGGNVLDSEAYQVANEYLCTKYPFSCLICLTPKEGSTRMGIVKRLTGPMTRTAYLAGIEGAIAKYAPDIDNVRSERAAQAVARNLRSEQDSAYERSLARDRERARQKREAAAAAAAAEKRALEEAAAAARQEELCRQWRQWRATKISPEPETGVRLALNMAASSGGERVIRKFPGETSLEDLYAFVECYDVLNEAQPPPEGLTKPKDYEHKYNFRIASVLPRETLEPSSSVTIAEKMGRGGSLVVEDITDDDDDNE
ncbi:UBX domain-containing protein 10 [Podospora aff. communis PSN243]|uniref:UBX domain-containing protein 10 n=1 Tax=Podospora aff. communis PSN243 TaxID=3040156 RepID=A0AAV9GYE0_9PEZI|nr:UBX domain-containing protein 10 [Podospora aff. communis PSN243]